MQVQLGYLDKQFNCKLSTSLDNGTAHLSIEVDGQKIEATYIVLKDFNSSYGLRQHVLLFIDSQPVEAFISIEDPKQQNKGSLTIEGQNYTIIKTQPGGTSHSGDAGAQNRQSEICSVMPGKVISVFVKAGDSVKANQTLMVVEAMKMENEIKTSFAGVVRDIHVEVGQSVEAQAVLAKIVAGDDK